MPGGIGVDEKLAGQYAVEEDLLIAQIHSVGEGIAGAGGPGVVAGKEHRAKIPGVQTGHHGKQIPRPAPEDVDLLRECRDVNVPGRVVGVLEEDALGAAVQGPLAGRLDLPGHLLLKGTVIVHGGALCLRPVGNAAGALNIGTDKYIHGKQSFPIISWPPVRQERRTPSGVLLS